jgi:hypothetical protein
MTPKQAALTATLVVLAIAGYCTWIALSPKETAIKILNSSIVVGCVLIAWMILFIVFLKSHKEN